MFLSIVSDQRDEVDDIQVRTVRLLIYYLNMDVVEYSFVSVPPCRTESTRDCLFTYFFAQVGESMNGRGTLSESQINIQKKIYQNV